MKLSSTSLRVKILFGALVLLVPLAVSLVYLYQAGIAQIQTAQWEKKGLAATAPVMKALLAWQTLGIDGTPDSTVLKALDEYVQALTPLTADLAYNAEAMTTAGYTWVGLPALQALVQAGAGGDVGKFKAAHDALMGDLLYLADSSGLVLDPDIDSYYLVLGLYQSLPGILDGATKLRSLSRPGSPKLTGGAKLLLFASASALEDQANKLQDQVARSVKGVPTSYGPVPGYEANMTSDVGPITGQTASIEGFANQSALAEAFDPQGMNSRLDALVPLLQTFYTHGRAALETMLDHRIASFVNELITAYSVALGGLVLGLTVLLVVVGGIRRRTAQLVGALGAVAQGDLVQKVPESLLKTQDELGRLAGSVKVLREDLRTQIESLTQATDRIAHMTSDLAANAEQSAAAIEEMSATSAQVARFARAQLDQTSASGEQIGEMLAGVQEAYDLTQGMATQFFLFSQSMEANRRRIAATAAEAKTTGELAEGLSKTGEQGERSLEALRQSIGSVVKKTQEIQEIVRFILDISDRTNLLSMNAAIEAAHAGHSGRGFAVVADEIRKLAENSSRQAQNIKTLVDGIAEAAHQTLDRSEGTTQNFRSVQSDIGAVRKASQAIAGQMVQQEEEDAHLSEGLEDFTRFYGDLSTSMDIQMEHSQAVQQAIGRLGDASKEISHSMQEQKLGMEQATEAVVHVRDTTTDLARIMEDLKALVARFQV